MAADTGAAVAADALEEEVVRVDRAVGVTVRAMPLPFTASTWESPVTRTAAGSSSTSALRSVLADAGAPPSAQPASTALSAIRRTASIRERAFEPDTMGSIDHLQADP